MSAEQPEQPATSTPPVTSTPPGTSAPAGGTARPGQDTSQDPTKDPADWATGGEPATGPQLSYLQTLAREAGEDVPEGLTKADASVLIDRLQGMSARVDDDPQHRSS